MVDLIRLLPVVLVLSFLPSGPVSADAQDVDADGIPNMYDPDIDGDGIPNLVEEDVGLNPTLGFDGAEDVDGDGYTNLVEYQRASYLDDPLSTPDNQRGVAKIKTFAFDALPDGEEFFGSDVAVMGDWAVVGASEGRVTDGSEVLPATGTVYVYRQQSGRWEFQAKLSPRVMVETDTGEEWQYPRDAGFGQTVAITLTADSDYPTILVGAPESHRWNGAFYVFKAEPLTGEWLQTDYVADDRRYGRLGYSLSIEGTVAMVGCPDCNQGQGSVFVYDVGSSEDLGAELTLKQTLTDRNCPYDSSTFYGCAFGGVIDIDGRTAVIGPAYQSHANRVYAYELTGGGWQLQQEVTFSDPLIEFYDSWGVSLALSGNSLVVSDISEEFGIYQGNLYTFRRVDGVWLEQEKLYASDVNCRSLGMDLAMEDSRLVATCENKVEQAYSWSVIEFERNQGIWEEQSRTFASPFNEEAQRSELYNYFGKTISLDPLSDTLFVGAHLDPDAGENAGAFYILDLSVSNTTD